MFARPPCCPPEGRIACPKARIGARQEARITDSAKRGDLPANGGSREENGGESLEIQIVHSVAGCFPGAAFVMAALQPTAIYQNAFHARDDYGLCFFDVIAGLFKQSNRVRRKTALDIETVGLPLMVDAGKIDGVLQIHTEIDDAQYHLQDGGNDARSSRSAENEKRLAIFQDDGGNH